MFQSITDVTDNLGQWLTWNLSGYEAIDLERHLVLETTNGRTRGARRWFVYWYNPATGKREWDYTSKTRVCFRAWNLKEALERVNEPRLAKRIERMRLCSPDAMQGSG